jgi:hypothetical protein
MSWGIDTEPEFQEKLHWIEELGGQDFGQLHLALPNETLG